MSNGFEWMLDVIEDLAKFADQNELGRSAHHFREIKQVVLSDIGAEQSGNLRPLDEQFVQSNGSQHTVSNQ